MRLHSWDYPSHTPFHSAGNSRHEVTWIASNQLKKEFEILFPEESTAIKQGKTHKHFLYAACIWRGFKAGKTGKVDVEK
jgi:hypothetical protein